MTESEKILFEADIRRYSDTILRIAVQNTNNIHSAEDIVQETFIRLFKNYDSFSDEEHKKAWLIRVAINLCRDSKKSFFFRKTEPIADIIAGSDDKALRNAEIMELVRKLPEKQKNALYLHYFEGYSIEEISAITGRNPRSIGSDLYRARKKLKAEFED